MDFEDELERLKQRFGNFGLLRFGAVWLLVISLFALFLPEAAGWGIAGALLAGTLILFSNAARGACAQRINSLIEYALLHTPEGQQAIRDEAARRLRDHDY